MPGPWNDSTDRQLLLTIIHLTAPQLPKWDEVAKLMGEGFTAESTRQHFQKLRKDCKAQFGDANGETGKTTPRKTKTPAAKGETPSKSTGKRKGRKSAEVEDDDESNGSPSKKAVKKEENDDEMT